MAGACYKPSIPFTSSFTVVAPVERKVGGVVKKDYPSDNSGFRINASFRTFGGTETNVNGLYSIIDTAEVETWYRSDITSDCILVNSAGVRWEIINEPENIQERNQFLKFKVRRLKAGV